MKPNSIDIGVDSKNRITMGVHRPTRVEDAIWDAVQTAIDSGWDAKQFKIEAAAAWEQTLRDDAKEAAKILSS